MAEDRDDRYEEPVGDMAIRASGGQAEDASLLDVLAAQREETASSREVYITIPGYEKSGMTLQARYTLLSGDDVADIGRKIMREFRKGQSYQRQLYASVDTMIAACTGIFVDREGEKIQLKNDGEEIIGFNDDLAAALKFQAEGARQCVFGVFCGNAMAVLQHSALLGRWMADTSTEVDTELLGIEGNL